MASRFLAAAGMEILARNFRCRGGEVDVVARDGSVVVFVEVKWRRGARHGEGFEAVTPAKQRRIALAARAWASIHPGAGRSYRFDVISIDAEASPPRVRHDRGAFTA